MADQPAGKLRFYQRSVICDLHEREQPAGLCNGCLYFRGEVKEPLGQVLGIACAYEYPEETEDE